MSVGRGETGQTVRAEPSLDQGRWRDAGCGRRGGGGRRDGDALHHLALEHHEGLVKYVANVVDAQLSAEDLPIDGISELHFADEESFRTRMYTHPESRDIIAADTKRFIGKSCAWFVREYHFR